MTRLQESHAQAQALAHELGNLTLSMQCKKELTPAQAALAASACEAARMTANLLGRLLEVQNG